MMILPPVCRSSTSVPPSAAAAESWNVVSASDFCESVVIAPLDDSAAISFVAGRRLKVGDDEISSLAVGAALFGTARNAARGNTNTAATNAAINLAPRETDA